MDWKKLIADLMAAGITQPQIAKRCGCSQATVSELATGVTVQPRYPLGAALVALHKTTTKRTRVDARKAAPDVTEAN